MTEISQALEEAVQQQAIPFVLENHKNQYFLLPNDHCAISDAARAIFDVIGPTNTLFVRGGVVVELFREKDGDSLKILRPEAFRSRIERYEHQLLARRLDGNGKLVFGPKRCPEETAKALLATREAIELLPSVTVLSRSPIIINKGDGEILRKGYHSENGGILILQEINLPEIVIGEAVPALTALLNEFQFQTTADHARGLAAFITPALNMGGFFASTIPVDIAEADLSQSGKTYRQKVVRAIYGEPAYPIARKSGGVGSLDESLSAALISGRPFITFDNVRGKLDSQFLEMITTFGAPVTARVPHRGEVFVNASNVTFQVTSNGLETTRDLANRSSIVRIKKRVHFAFKEFPEGDLLRHVESNRAYYLGCVFSVIREWIRNGKPRIRETRHDLKEWAGILDWICQKVFGCSPLMDGHESAQVRVSNPSLTWLRRVALAIKTREKLGVEFSASELYTICEEEDIDIPGLRAMNEELGRKFIGSAMGRCFEKADEMLVEDLVIRRRASSEYNEQRQENMPLKKYSVHFKCIPPTPASPPTSITS
jgi:hypothetical protein